MLIDPYEHIVAAQIIKPSPDPKLPWALFDRNARYEATMKDENFIAKLQSGELSLSKGDTLVANMLSRTTRLSDGSLHTENTITEVIKHERAGFQDKLL